MKVDSKFAAKIQSGGFIVTGEFLPTANTEPSAIKDITNFFGGSLTAANVADNHCGISTSSLAVSCLFNQAGIEPVYQIVTRDRNRIALQSDLLGAAVLGIKNVLCLSGYHQTLGICDESANVYEIDSTQLVNIVKTMRDQGQLLDGTKIQGDVAFCIGAAANPYMEPLELNILRLVKKAESGADFIQTQAVFDTEVFSNWLEAANAEGITGKCAILAGVLPLKSAAEAEELNCRYTDIRIPDVIIERIKSAGSDEAQKKEGLAVCVEIIQKIKGLQGLRGIHILSGGNEAIVPELIAAAGL